MRRVPPRRPRARCRSGRRRSATGTRPSRPAPPAPGSRHGLPGRPRGRGGRLPRRSPRRPAAAWPRRDAPGPPARRCRGAGPGGDPGDLRRPRDAASACALPTAVTAPGSNSAPTGSASRAEPAHTTGPPSTRRAAATRPAASSARGTAGIVEAPRQQPRVDLDRLEQGEALGQGSSVVERDDVGDLPTGGLGGAAGGTAGDLARNRDDGQAADLARGVAFDPVRGAQQVLVAAGKARIARCLQLLDQLPSQLGGSPRGGLRRVRNDAPPASRPPHDARLDPRRADVDEERHLGTDRCRHDSRPSQSPSRKARRSIRSTRRERSR